MRRIETLWMTVGLVAILAIWLAWVLVQPILDAVVFWHMSYAQYMLTRHMLRGFADEGEWNELNSERNR